MKKLLCIILIFFIAISVFAYDITTDVLFGGNYNYTVVSNNLDDAVKGYNGIFNSLGGSIGIDLFFNPSPVGIYLRTQFMGMQNMERTAGGKTVDLENTELSYNAIIDIGPIIEIDIVNHFSFNIAPAFSFLFISSQYQNLFVDNPRATIDASLGMGISADLNFKFRYSYFVATMGCSGAIYPFADITSADSELDYHDSNFDKVFDYNIKPYISLGFSIREINNSHIITSGD